MALLLGPYRNLSSDSTIHILNLASALAELGEEVVAQDGEEPRPHTSTGLEAVDVRQAFEQRLLDEIIGSGEVAGERDREGSQVGQDLNDLGTGSRGLRH